MAEVLAEFAHHKDRLDSKKARHPEGVRAG